jgi:hypothetical protein
MNAKIQTNPLPNAKGAFVSETDYAKVLVAMKFHQAIKGGTVSLRGSKNGQTEFRLNSGEVFLLEADSVTRLKNSE